MSAYNSPVPWSQRVANYSDMGKTITPNREFADLVHLCRCSKKWTRRELAKHSGVEASYITRIEAGYTPRRHACEALMKALEMDPMEASAASGYWLLNAEQTAFLKAQNLNNIPQARVAHA